MNKLIWICLLFISLGSSFCLSNDGEILALYENKQSNIQVSGKGTVVRVLPDDTVGSRHQKFILRLDNGMTLLVAHNIDLAPRLNSLRETDSVNFFGEYEWTEKGGVVHWTHKDPNNNHVAGWLIHKGVKYEQSPNTYMTVVVKDEKLP